MKRLIWILAVPVIFFTACKKDDPAILATLTTTVASNVTANAITSGGNITNDGNATITQRGIAWATHAGPTVADSITKDGGGAGTFSSTISGLNANTTYYFRAYAVNSAGTAYGNEITLATPKGAPTVVTSAVSDIQPLSATASGNITNDGGANVTERGIVYAITPNPTMNDHKIVEGSGYGTFTVTLEPLASQQTYYVKAYATNSYGTTYGNQVQFNAASANTVVDIDGNVYPYVTIGTQSWMQANLKVSHFNNGDSIPNGLNWTADEWIFHSLIQQSGVVSDPIPSYTFPNGDSRNNNTYGKLYYRTAVTDSRGLCPTGWHVPTLAEWSVLLINQGLTQAQIDNSDPAPAVGIKLLEGGSSGLNLQKAGTLYIQLVNGQTSATYGNFGKESVYHMADERFGVPLYIDVNSIAGPNGIYIGRGISSLFSVRCVKN